MLRRDDAEIKRASRVEVVEVGPNCGRFYVDLSLLSELSGNPELCVCLVDTFDTHTAAVAAEVEFIKRNWLLEKTNV